MYQPEYLGGVDACMSDLSSLLNLDEWKKNKAGLYTVYVTQDWKGITVSADAKKAKDTDLVKIPSALKSTAPKWSHFLLGDKVISRYTLQIQLLLVE